MTHYLDEVAREDFKKAKASVVAWILMASYAYYLRYESLLSDECFDKMCHYLLENYDSVQHRHKHLITKDMLKAGSCYNLTNDDYPNGLKMLTEAHIRSISMTRAKSAKLTQGEQDVQISQ